MKVDGMMNLLKTTVTALYGIKNILSLNLSQKIKLSDIAEVVKSDISQLNFSYMKCSKPRPNRIKFDTCDDVALT